MIAALFVEKNGIYYGLEDIDPWDKARDARLYDGPHSVIAHPPCQRYTNLGKVNYVRWGGSHNRPLNDHGCFAAAVASVNCWSGVLEHPAFSYAWEVHNLNYPVHGEWIRSGIGWVTEVWQSAYGHLANKRTWLYYVGEQRPYDLDWRKPTGSHQIGHPDKRGKIRNKPTLSKKAANATPFKFRDELINLVRFP